MIESAREIDAVQFGLLSPEEIKKFAVIEIVSSDLNYVGDEGQGGLNDAHMGVVNKGERCKTCYLDSEQCPGHFGYINLAYPLFKQEYSKNVKLILELTCIHCNQLLYKKEKLKNETNGLHPNDAYTVLKKMLPVSSTVKICIHCQTVQPKLKPNTMLSIEYTYSHIRNVDYQKNNVNAVLPPGIDEKAMTDFQMYPHTEIYKRLKGLSNDTISILRLNPKYARPEWMMWTVFPVSPPVVRPNTQNDGQHSYDDWTHSYMTVIDLNNKLKNSIESGKEIKTLITELNSATAACIFNSINTAIHKQTRKPLTSVKSRLDGKDGLFRRNLIAKRVNFGGRSVVSAGPHTRMHFLGVPKKIAMTLSVPITATKYNIHILQKAVLNGPYVYPGANYISSNGNTRNLKIGNRQDIVVQIGDKVGLHLTKGTPILFNRQPSLWRVNMLCHSAEIVPHNTFRLNLSACNPYNADFDGDEMNCHVPQSEATLAECKSLMMVHNHMISSQTSAVMTGIEQDSLTGIALFTHEDIRFNRMLAAELALFGDKFDAIDLNSKEIWSSRDIMSLILPKINLNTYSKLKDYDIFTNGDKKVSIVNGEHLSGVIDKETVGTGSQGSIIHIIWRDYGPKAASDFITHIQEISAHFLLNYGFSISVGDMIASKKSIKAAKQVVINEFEKIRELVQKIDNGQFVTPVDVTVEEWFEQQAFLLLGSPLTEQAGKHTYNEINTRNNAFATMIRYGSNGESIHIKQVTAAIGQQSSNGKRAEPTYGGRTLPFYQKSEIDPISKGYAFHSYLEGYTFIEAFFISQCGREGITSTAINTASAGYLARRMTKMNERIIVGYDYMAKAGNEIIQLIYPFDAWYMETQRIEHVKINKATFNKIYKWDDAEIKKLSTGSKQILSEEYSAILRDRATIHKASANTTINDAFAFPLNIRRIVLGMIAMEKTINRKKYDISDKSITEIHQKIKALCESLPVFFTNPNVKNIPKRFREVSEMTCILIRSILTTKRIINEYAISSSSLNYAINEIKRHFAIAIIAPKEMIGYVSAQSISEIATQVTIDAFHNVGISSSGKKERVQTFSRLLEILNYKKETNYPLMIIPLAAHCKQNKEEAVILKNKIENIHLRVFLQKTEIIYDPDPMNPVVYDKALVDAYFKYTPNEREKVPGGVSSYMVRMTLNRQKVYHKQIDMLTFKLKLEEFSNLCYVIIGDINAEELIIRVHFNMANLKDFSPDYELRHVEKILDYIIHDVKVRGIKGLANINIVENLIEKENEDGELEQIKEYHLETEGTNIYGVAGLLEDRIDKTRLETNEISMVYKKYGIEAARKIMIKEAIEILRATKPKMSYMHMRLLIDNMTYGGFIMPLNRHGFKRRNPGALIRMAFEQNTMQITKAALYAELDELKNSPTGGVMFGQLLPCGTGSMVDVYIDESKVGISNDVLDSIF